MNGLPHIVWDGVVHQVGSGPHDIDGTNFQAIIDERLLEDAPLSVSVTSHRFFGSDPYVTVEVEVFEELPLSTDTYLRVGILENGLSYGGHDYDNVLRDMLEDTPLTVQHIGETQEVTLPVFITGPWDPSELWAFAIVQRDLDRQILNAGSTKATPYSLYAETDGGQTAVIDGSHTFGTTEITHDGMASSHTFDISMDTSQLPAGWDAYFTLDDQDLTFATVTLAQDEAVDLDVTLVPGAGEYNGTAMLNLHSHSGEMPDLDLPFTGMRLGAEVLIVATDTGNLYAADYFEPAVTASGRSYSVWDRGSASIDAATMQSFDAVIWYSGDYGPGLSEGDRAEIEAYLDSGGNMLFSGQNLAAQTVDAGGSTWMISTLRTFYQSSANSGPLVAGVAGDPISDGLSLDLQGGDGAGNYYDPDVVTPFGGAEGIFTYTATGTSAGVRVEYGGYKHIFLGFGFESINSVADRNALMNGCLVWLIGAPTAVDNVVPPVATLYQNLPNPFNPQTTIAFDLPTQMAVSLCVYDISGRLVDVLLNNEIGQQGRNEVVWRGDDASGQVLPSGTYFYRIEGRDFGDTKRMTLLK